MSVFDDMTNDEIQAAQDRLDELCNRHDVEKFSVQGGVGLAGWLKLIQAMCGVDVNQRDKSGRKANPDELVDDVRRQHALYTDFGRVEIFDDKDKTKQTTYKVLPDFYGNEIHNFIADSLSEKYRKKITPSKIRGILNNKHNKEQLERLTRDEFKELENVPFDPDEFIEDVK
ncbi:MAG: hypothetical protein IT559_01745 [Alphaproteobacteria bacterium]|nr:hypothetical protein [Alphaproteobacteria bacterium]